MMASFARPENALKRAEGVLLGYFSAYFINIFIAVCIC